MVLSAVMGSAAHGQTFSTGLNLASTEDYEAFASLPRFRSFLPESADLSQWMPAVGDQGQQSSCTAWSTAYYMRSYYV